MTIITQQLKDKIAESGFDVHRALSVTLGERDVKTALLKKEQERSKMLLDALETIRQLIWAPGGPQTGTERVMDKIAQNVLRASGEIATTTEED